MIFHLTYAGIWVGFSVNRRYTNGIEIITDADVYKTEMLLSEKNVVEFYNYIK